MDDARDRFLRGVILTEGEQQALMQKAFDDALDKAEAEYHEASVDAIKAWRVIYTSWR